METKTTTKKVKTLNEEQFKKLVRDMARKAIKEHVAKKLADKQKALNEAKAKQAAKPAAKKVQKITVEQLRVMIKESVKRHLETKSKKA